MAFRDILVVAAARADQFVLDYAASAAAHFDAHLNVLLIGWKPQVPSYWEGRTADPPETGAMAAAEKALNADRVRLQASLDRKLDHTWVEAALIDRSEARHLVARHARHADITIVGRPDVTSLGDLHTPFIEGALFASGRPILIVPPDWRGEATFENVVVCWKNSREASRAAADAAPLIEAAGRVTLLTVKDEEEEAGLRHTGASAALGNLYRHNRHATARSVPNRSAPDAEILLEEIRSVGADLVVMGGYGRSRFSELVLGGATRDMLANCPMPILMSH